MLDRNTSALTQQFIALLDKGMTPEEISESFQDSIEGLTPEAVMLAVRSATSQKRVSADELIDKYRIDAIHYLGGLIEDPNANEHAKVKAAQILVDRKGCLPLVEADDVAAMFKKMKELRQANDEKIVKLEQTTKAA
jgi:hypothetical protein